MATISPGTRPGGGHARLSGLVLITVVLAQCFVLRDVTGPVVFADELGYVAAARYFGSGLPDVQMLSAFYHFGYGLLLAPLTFVFDEPAGFYRAATIFNGVMAVSATLVFHRIVLLRQLRVAPPVAAAAACAFALAPPLLINTRILWAETALVALTTVLVAALFWLLDRPTVGRAFLVGLLAAFGYGLHPRAIVVSLSVAGALGLAWLVRSLSFRVAFSGMTACAVGLVLVRAMNATLRVALYAEGSITQSAGGILGDQILGNLGQWTAGLLGTAWYQLAASFGLVAFGIWFWVRSAAGARPGQTKPVAIVGAFLLASLLISWLVGAVIAVAEQPRVDQAYYGRYLDFLAPLAIGFGIVELAQRRGRNLGGPVVALSIPVLGWLVERQQPTGFFEQLTAVAANVPMADAGEVLLATWKPLSLGLAAGAGALVVLTLVHRYLGLGVALFAVLTLGAAELTLTNTFRPASRASFANAALARPLEDIATGDTVLVVAPYEFWTLYNLQFWADDVQFALESDCPTAAHEAVIAPADDPRFIGSVPTASDQFGQRLLGEEADQHLTSRSVAIDILEVNVMPDSVLVSARVINADDRFLVVGDRLLLHGRWLDPLSGETLFAERVSISFEVEPHRGSTIELVLSPPPVAPGTLDLEFDIEDVGRGWLSVSGCQQSRFDQVSVTLD